MITETYTTKVIKADEGYILTQSADIDIKERIFGTVIYLASTDSEDNYKEITVEEADILKEEQRIALEEARLAYEEEMQLKKETEIE